MLRLAILILVLCALAVGCDDDGANDGATSTALAGTTATFVLGVASGDVTTDGAVLWTRAEGGDSVAVDVARDVAFDDIVASETGETSATRDFTVKIAIDGLDPAMPYFYRFRAGDSVSETGMFETAPADDAAVAVRFVFSGDSDGSRKPDGSPTYNEFDVLDSLIADEPDFFLYFGDTIYADREPTATTLDGYRGKYRETRGYERLRKTLAATSVYTMWDDHEVVNDFAGKTVDPAMFEAGRQAFREYMPIRGDDEPETLYRSFRWGSEVELIVLDERSFRDGSAAAACTTGQNPDPVPDLARPETPDSASSLRGFAGLPAELAPACLTTIDDRARTMLGSEQLEYFKTRLRESDATWKVVVNEVPMQALVVLPYDRWEGYAAERRAILEFIRDEGITNVVFVTTDFHATLFGAVRMDPFVDNEPIAYEAVAGPIATAPLAADVVEAIGETAARVLQPFFESVVGVDCANLESYAYALVEVDPAGTMTITSKDQTGMELCKQTLEAKR